MLEQLLDHGPRSSGMTYVERSPRKGLPLHHDDSASANHGITGSPHLNGEIQHPHGISQNGVPANAINGRDALPAPPATVHYGDLGHNNAPTGRGIAGQPDAELGRAR